MTEQAIRREKFFAENNLSDKDIDFIADIWNNLYGNYGKFSNTYNHHYLQGIIEHGVNEWDEYKNKLHPLLKKLMIRKFPQLTKLKSVAVKDCG